MQENNKELQPEGLAISINLDTTPILYTDNIFLNFNEDGLVLDICQKLGPSNQLRIVSRIGMSKAHAKKFANILGNLIVKSEGKMQTGKKVIN